MTENKLIGKKVDNRIVGEIIYTFRVLRDSWELDNIGYLVRLDDGRVVVVLTNHNHPYISDQEELLKLVEGYKTVLAATELAIHKLNEKDEE